MEEGTPPEGAGSGAAMGAFAAKKAAMKLKQKQAAQLPPATKEGGVAKVQHNHNPTSHSRLHTDIGAFCRARSRR